MTTPQAFVGGGQAIPVVQGTTIGQVPVWNGGQWVPGFVSAVTPNQVLVSAFGAAGNANFQNPDSLKWYVDAEYLVEASDDSAAIAAAFAAASESSASGQPSVVVLTGNHYIKTPQLSNYGPLNQFAFFVVPSSCTIEGNGNAWLRIAPGLNAMVAPNGGGWAMFANSSSVSNVVIHGVNFDGNGQSGSPTSQANSFISLLGNATNNLTIDSCLFYNQSGWNAVIVTAVGSGLLGQNVAVSNCSFVEIGNNGTLTDHVALYLQAEGVAVTGNVFFNDPSVSATPRNNGQGIQGQGTGWTISGNQFTNMANAILMVSAFTSPNCNSSDWSITGNTFTLCSKGVQFSQAVGLTLQNVAIVGNAFTISNDSQGQAESAVYCNAVNGSNGEGLHNLTIVGNSMIYVHDSRWADAAPTAISFGCVVTGLIVSDNIIEGFSQGAVLIAPSAASNPNAPSGTVTTSDLKIWDLSICDNAIRDCGLVRTQAVLLQCDTAGLTAQRINVRDNIVTSTGSALTYGIYCDLAGDSLTVVGNVTQNVTTPVTISSSNGITNHLSGGLIGDNGTTTTLGQSGHTVTFTGQPILAVNQYLQYVVGTGYNVLGVDASGTVRIAPNANMAVAIGAPATFSGSASGDAIMAQGTYLRFSSSGSTHEAVGYDGSEILIAPGDPVIVGASGQSVGFYGGTPAAQASRAGQLTDSTGGTPSSTIASAGTVFSEGTLNNNFASMAQRINALETIVHNLGLST